MKLLFVFLSVISILFADSSEKMSANPKPFLGVFLDENQNLAFNQCFDHILSDFDENGIAEVEVDTIEVEAERLFINKNGTILSFEEVKLLKQLDFDINSLLVDITYPGKYGYRDRNYQEVISYEYDSAFKFEYNGLGMVEKKKKYGFIDSTGKVIVPIIYDNAEWFLGKNFTIVQKDGKYGTVDKNGKTIIPLTYSYIGSNFHENVEVFMKNNLYGFVESNGNEIIKEQYENAKPFKNGFAAVKLNNKWGIISKTNDIIIPFMYENATVSSNGLFEIQLNGQWNYLTQNNEFIFSTWFSKTKEFKNGFAEVSFDSGNTWTYIDNHGNIHDNSYLLTTASNKNNIVLAYEENKGWTLLNLNENKRYFENISDIEEQKDNTFFIKKDNTWISVNEKGIIIEKSLKPVKYEIASCKEFFNEMEIFKN